MGKKVQSGNRLGPQQMERQHPKTRLKKGD